MWLFDEAFYFAVLGFVHNDAIFGGLVNLRHNDGALKEKDIQKYPLVIWNPDYLFMTSSYVFFSSGIDLAKTRMHNIKTNSFQRFTAFPRPNKELT